MRTLPPFPRSDKQFKMLQNIFLVVKYTLTVIPINKTPLKRPGVIGLEIDRAYKLKLKIVLEIKRFDIMNRNVMQSLDE